MFKLTEALNVDELEVFDVYNKLNEYLGQFRVKDNKLETFDYSSKDVLNWMSSRLTINELLSGKIVKTPRFPEEQTKYYYISKDGAAISTKFTKECENCITHFKLGNFYLPHRFIPRDDIEFWINFYNDSKTVINKDIY